jgi:hypothetical protein
VSKVLPYAVAAVLIAWTVGYGRYQGRKGERMAAAYSAVAGSGEGVGTGEGVAEADAGDSHQG